MNIVSVRVYTDALIAKVATLGFPVHDLHVSEGTALPYVRVQASPGGAFDGPLGAPFDDASLPWLVSNVGESRMQCEWMADRTRALLLSEPLAVAGRSVAHLELDVPGGANEDLDVEPPRYFLVDRWMFTTTPT